MFRWITRGIMPSSEEELFKKQKPLTKSNAHAEHYQEDQESFKFEKGDYMAMVIALAQVLLPFAVGFAGVYILVILFITNVWLR